MNTNHVTHNLQLSAWANRIREQQVSGLNIKAWCYQNHFTKDQYYYWKRLLKEACLEARLPGIVQVPLPIVEECCSTCTTITPPSTPSTADGDLYAAKELSSAVPQSTPTSKPTDSYPTRTTLPTLRLQIKDVTVDISYDTPDSLISKVVKAVRYA